MHWHCASLLYKRTDLEVRDGRVEARPVELQPDGAARERDARRGHRVQRRREARRGHGHVHQARGRRKLLQLLLLLLLLLNVVRVTCRRNSIGRQRGWRRRAILLGRDAVEVAEVNLPQAAGAESLIGADGASEGPRAGVDAHVRLEAGLPREEHVAHAALRLVLEGEILCMKPTLYLARRENYADKIAFRVKCGRRMWNIPECRCGP